MNIILIFFLIQTPLAFAFSGFESTLEIDDHLGKTVKLLQQNKLREAVDLLSESWVGDKSEMDAFYSKTKETMAMTEVRIGKNKSFERMGSCTVKDFLYQVQYVQKNEKSPIYWHFTYYNSGKGWHVQSFIWDDKLDYSLTRNCI